MGNVQKIPVYLLDRIIRIYPLYLIYLFFSILLVAVFRKTGIPIFYILPFTLTDIVKNIFLYPYVIYPIAEVQYWPILPVAWFLTYQMLLYVSYIFFILNKKIGVIIFSCWSVIIVLYCCGIFQPSNYLIKFLLNPLIILFPIGMLVAYAVLSLGSYFKKSYVLLLMTRITCLVLSWIFAYYDYFHFKTINRIFTHSLPYTLIIFGVALWEKYYLKDIKQNKIFSLGAYLGDASYSIYLSHYWILFVIYYYVNKFDKYPIINEYFTFSIVSLITLCVGLLCYQLLEKPLLRKVKRMFFSSSIKTC